MLSLFRMKIATHFTISSARPAERDSSQRTGDWALQRRDSPPGVVRMIGLVGAETSFETGSVLLSELAGLPVSPKQVERTAEALGAELVEDEQACPDPDPVAHLPSTLYLGPDGTGIPMRKHARRRDGSWRTTVVYSVTDDDWPLVRSNIENQILEYCSMGNRGDIPKVFSEPD